MNIEVIQAIMNTKKVLNEHWEKTISMRLSGIGQTGSYYPQHNEAKTLEADLLEGGWEELDHPAIMKGCKAYKTNIPGKTGMQKLDLLSDPEDYEVKLIDAKNTGFLSAVIGINAHIVKQASPTNFTVIIIGEHQGEKVVFTFHPGNPVEPSSITGEERTVTVQEAIDLGFGLAKIEIDGL
jgi:hypothetical protein